MLGVRGLTLSEEEYTQMHESVSDDRVRQENGTVTEEAWRQQVSFYLEVQTTIQSAKAI